MKPELREELSKEGVEILDLLHKCLDPYLPPIISDSKHSLRIIAYTIDRYYTRKGASDA